MRVFAIEGEKLRGLCHDHPTPPRHNVLRNQAFVCPECGELWGRLILDKPEAKWQASTRPCPRHGGGYFLSPLTWHRVPFERIEPRLWAWELAHLPETEIAICLKPKPGL